MGETRYLAASGPHDATPPHPDVALVGVPYDGAVTYRSGAAAAPTAIRRASESIESYCPRLDMDLADAPFVDLGDLDVEPLADTPTPGTALVRHLRRQVDQLPDLPLLAVGGDHLVAYPFLERALERHPDLAILHVDAHADLRDAWDGDPFNHSTVMGRVVDRMPPTARLYPWGIRSGLREEFQRLAQDERILRQRERDGVRALVWGWVRERRPVYITLDVDGLDPSAVPGTGTPEPGGLGYDEVEGVLAELRGGHVVGADLVELAPPLDPSGVTDVVGARIARTLLLLLRASRPTPTAVG